MRDFMPPLLFWMGVLGAVLGVVAGVFAGAPAPAEGAKAAIKYLIWWAAGGAVLLPLVILAIEGEVWRGPWGRYRPPKAVNKP